MVTTTQNVLKNIARMSNFNVDIQCKVTLGINCYRAICTACNDSIPISQDVSLRSEFDDNFIKFCKEHRHDIEARVVEEVTGRKFR
jgi:hypothetical protein